MNTINQTELIDTPAAIADGSSYRAGDTHFFFDRQARVVRSTQGLKRLDAEFLGSPGLKIIAIGDLYQSRGDAVDHGQRLLLDEIEAIRDKILELERSKPKAQQSLKRILQARGL
jgi:hypothetical protein